MQQSDFVHLHVHSDYSLLDGVARIPKLVARAAECGQKAIALTDHGTVSGVVSFYKEAQKAGVKPILGCELYLSLGAHTARTRGYHHLTVLAKDDQGWKNLSKLTSVANLEGFYYRPRVDWETLVAHKAGLVILSGCLKGPVAEPLVQGREADARAAAAKFKEAFGEDFYLEVQPNTLPEQRLVNEGCTRLARELGIKLSATCDLHYVDPQDAPAQEVRICIAQGNTISDPSRLQMKEDFFFRSSEQMASAFRDQPDAILNTREIAEKISGYDLLPGKKSKYFLPTFTPPDGSTPDDFFVRECEAGLLERYGVDPAPAVRERLEYEKGVIKRLNFVNYFLIVADFIEWARTHECAVGPGRGSAAGSIVAYCLGITDIDPLKYDLLFERFLNPSRVTMPDIDVDFCEANRERVIEHVREKYGRDNVCQIVTFGTLKPKAVIKDVGRVLELPFAEVDRISKLIPEGPKLKSLEQAFTESPELSALRGDPRYGKLFEMSLALEGINRHAGKHAAGVVISDTHLLERIPLMQVKGDKTTQFTMMEVEEVGLLKMDFLGLRTLTLIEDCLELLRRKGVHVDLDKVPLDDAPTYAMLARAETQGVFQLESSGFRKLLKEAKPDRFEDIIALIALYRPGPLGSGMDQLYCNTKHGREPLRYLTPHLEPILGATYGCILYQEQVMQIANQIAGLSMVDADALRKAMGKKQADVMDKYKPKFIEGFKKKEIDVEIATKVWDQIAFFAEYGFNKCVVGSTTLVDAATGERTTVRDLFEDRRDFTVHALGDDWRLRPRRVLDVVSNGPRPVFALTTNLGKRLVATGNHPVRTLDGWKNLADLAPGEPIAAPEDWTPWQRTEETEAFASAGGTAVAVRVRPIMGIVWDRVVSVEPAGHEETFDLEVDIDHNFVADGLVVHNSHSAAYGLVTYRTAWLKAHHPAEFMAASMTSFAGDVEKLVEFKVECDRMGIGLVPPDVSQSAVKFEVNQAGKIVWGLSAIRGVGEGATEKVIEGRRKAGGRFRSIFQFCEEVDLTSLNKSFLEALVKAGAFDNTGAKRRQLFESIDLALQMGITEQKERASNQTSLFGDSMGKGKEDLATIEQKLLPAVPEWKDAEILAGERESLGFFLTRHPLDPHRETVTRFATAKSSELQPLGEKAEVTLGGMITSIRTLLDKKGNTMAFLTLEDFNGQVDCVVFGSVYGENRQAIHQDAVVFIRGKVSLSREAPSIIVDKVLPAAEATGQLRVSVSAELVLEETTGDMLKRFRDVLMQHRGNDPVYYSFRRKSDEAVAGPFKVGSHFKVKGTDALKDELLSFLGPGTRIRIGAAL